MPGRNKEIVVAMAVVAVPVLFALMMYVGNANSATAGASDWRPDVRAATAYAERQGGSVSFAVRTPTALRGYRMRRVTVSASVVKAMLMVTYLNSPEVRGRKLRRADLALIGPMVRRSDNATATTVRNLVGNAALRRLARRVGMRDFATAVSWGNTRITAADQARFFFAIDRYVVARHRKTALRLLASIVPAQRWGIAQVRPPGWALYFKSGFVPYTQNQVSLLRRGRHRVAVAVLTSGLEWRAGRSVEREVARRLLRGLRPDSVPR